MKTPDIVPYGFMPDTTEFRALLRDCSVDEFRNKFKTLEKLSPRALRAEVGSAARLINAVFRSPAFLKRCRGGFDLGQFLQNSGKQIVERGDENEDVNRSIMGGINMLAVEYCENRPQPYPPVRIYLDECTSGRTAGKFEEQKAGETRKNGLSWSFSLQWPNFENGADGFYQNCPRKEISRTGHYELARKFAAMAAAGFHTSEEMTHAAKVTKLTALIMEFKPGERLITDRTGSRIVYTPMLDNPWPNWPGLRDAKLQEKIEWIRNRPEYRPVGEPRCLNISQIETPRPDKLPDDSSPATRLKRHGKKPADRSSNTDDANASGFEAS